jgi:hypothetical protein
LSAVLLSVVSGCTTAKTVAYNPAENPWKGKAAALDYVQNEIEGAQKECLVLHGEKEIFGYQEGIPVFRGFKELSECFPYNETKGKFTAVGEPVDFYRIEVEIFFEVGYYIYFDIVKEYAITDFQKAKKLMDALVLLGVTVHSGG